MKNHTRRCYLDANILIYAKDEKSILFKESSLILQRLFEKNYQICISPLVIDEFLYTMKHYFFF